jgi:hypothetical protein
MAVSFCLSKGCPKLHFSSTCRELQEIMTPEEDHGRGAGNGALIYRLLTFSFCWMEFMKNWMITEPLKITD